MFHDRRQRHVKRRGEFADGQIGLFGEPRDQCAARRIGKRGKGAVERGGTKLNHVVKYRNRASGVKRVVGWAAPAQHRIPHGRPLWRRVRVDYSRLGLRLMTWPQWEIASRGERL